MVKFIWKLNLPIGFYATFKVSPGRLGFLCSKGKKWDPPETPKLKVREVSQIGFSNISLHPISVPGFSQIGWPQLLAPGTLSQTMTLLKLHSLNTKYQAAIYRRGLQICLHVSTPVVHGWVEEQVKSVIHQMDELRTSPCSSQVSLLFLCEILHATNLEVEILGDEENYGILNINRKNPLWNHYMYSISWIMLSF